jgi:uncharacterized protein
MDIKHSESQNKGRFYMEDAEGLAAEITYSIAGTDKFIIDHTEVTDRHRGKKIGFILVEAMVNYARKRKMKIIPLCPFAKQAFERNKEYLDTLS